MWDIAECERQRDTEQYGGELELEDLALPDRPATGWVVEEVRASLSRGDWRTAFWLMFTGLTLCFLAAFVAGMVRGEVSFRTLVDLLIGFGSGVLGREMWVRRRSET